MTIIDEVFEVFEGLFLSKNISILLFLLNMYFYRDKTECSGALKATYILKSLIRWCVEGASLLSTNMPLFLFLFSNKIVSKRIFKLCFRNTLPLCTTIVFVGRRSLKNEA